MKRGELVRVTNTLHLYRKIGIVIDIKRAGESIYVQILTDCGACKIIPGHWVEVLQ